MLTHQIDLGEYDKSIKRIDSKATRQRVSKYLEYDYPRLKRIASRVIKLDDGIKSPVISDMPKGGGHGNRVEDRLVKDIENKRQAELEIEQANQAVTNTEAVINSLGHNSRKILTELFINGKTDRQVYIDCYFSESSYFHKFKPQALLEFAEATGMLVYRE